ncbi:MAG: hypothetical protein AAFN77_01850 [Planctomycetota bacterium]
MKSTRFPLIGLCTAGLLFWLTQLAAIGQSTGQPSEAMSDERVRLTMKIRLTDQRIAKLKSTGRLNAEVPLDARNRIDGVRLSRDFSFINGDFVADQHVEKRGDLLIIHLDDAKLDRLDYQPLMSKVYFSNYSTVVLAYHPTVTSATGETHSKQLASNDSEETTLFARIDQRRGIRGKLMRPSTIEMKTQFGGVEVNPDKIKGVRFFKDRPSEVTVWMANGDQVSGTISFDEITMACSWGDQSIPVADLESLTRTRFTVLPKQKSARPSASPFQEQSSSRSTTKPNKVPEKAGIKSVIEPLSNKTQNNE